MVGGLSTVVLSVRVRRELKEEAERLGIDLREAVERALEEEVRRVKMERMRMLIGEALKSMDLEVEEWVKAVKEMRLKR
jgi:post-segregation antitoxin (ccd killing protein)